MTGEHWTCPFCDRDVLINPSYSSLVETADLKSDSAEGPRRAVLRFTVCPNARCRRTTLTLTLFELVPQQVDQNMGIAGRRPDIRTEYVQGAELVVWRLIPSSTAKTFPDYVPKAIRLDYEEACAIRDGSPKGAATLARRALQGMIRDFWGIRENRLVDEIEALKGSVDEEVWDAIDAVRTVGNIGAHMEQDVNLVIDVEPQEAEALIGLIEMLIREWYIRREERKRALATVKSIASAKTAAKKGPPGGAPPPTPATK